MTTNPVAAGPLSRRFTPSSDKSKIRRLRATHAAEAAENPARWLTAGCLFWLLVSSTSTSRTARAEDPQHGFGVHENDDGVLVTDHGKRVLFYQRRPKSQEGEFTRANYIHPLYDLDGAVLTEDFPRDHRHHRGIFWAWHQVSVGDMRLGDPWLARDFEWDVDELKIQRDRPGSLALALRVLWKSPLWTNDNGDAKPVVEERTVIRIHHSTPHARMIDFEIRLLALEPRLRVGGSEDEKGYGGFCARVRLPEDVRFLGRNGEVAPQTLAVDAGPWLDVTAAFGETDTLSGLTILGHPTLPGFPQPWILRRTSSMQNAVYPGRDAVELSQTTPLVLRYRLVVHRGSVGADVLEHWFDAFADRHFAGPRHAKTDQRTSAAAVVSESPQQPDRAFWKQAVEPGDPLSLFTKRILPILKSDSSSCRECHFVGVDLQNFIRDDQAQTFASLRDRGLIDTKHPDESKVLTFIARTPAQSNALAAKVRRNEFQAFRAWIHAAVRDPQLLNSTTDKQTLGTEIPVEVIRHARKDRVLSSFVENVWSQMGRCISCHSPDRNERLVQKHGAQVSWIAPGDPAATLAALVEAGNIDLDFPEESQMLTKPAGLVEHGGGPKFLVGDSAYRGFLRFATDYAAMVGNRYKHVDDLPRPPAEVILLTLQHLRITGLPERFAQLPLKVDLYRWDAARRTWSQERWGTAFGPVNGEQRQWQNMINVTAPRASDRAQAIGREPRLPSGSYLAKIYVDQDRRTEKDPNYELAEQEFFGQLEITGDWPPGYQPPKTVDAANLTAADRGR